MSAHFTTPTDELLLLAETLGEVKTKADKLEAEFATQARPLEAATNALSAALSGIKALQFHVLDNNLGQLSARVEEMRKAVDEQVGVIALELKKADETNAAKAGQEAEALRSEIAALQAQLGTLGAQFSAQLERVEFSAKEEAKKLQLIPGPAGAAGASLNPRGTFIDGETYNRLDVVSWLGSSYIAAVDGVTEKPSKNSNQWQVLASRGGGAAGGAGDFGSLAGVAQINQGGTGQTTRAAGLNALLPDQAGATQYMLLTDGAGNVSWGAQPVAGLPSQTSNGGKLLTTDGTSASWSNAVTVSGSNATVTGTLNVNGTDRSQMVGNANTRLEVGNSIEDQRAHIGLVQRLNLGNPIFSKNLAGKSASDAYTTIATTAASGYSGIECGYGGVIRLLNGTGATTAGAEVTPVNVLDTTTTRVAIPLTTASTSASSGALIVSGGVGVGGNITVGGQLDLNSGTAAAPSLKLNGTNNGLFYNGSNIVRIAANATEAATFSATAATVAGTFTANTSVNSPQLVISDNSLGLTGGAGFYKKESDTVALGIMTSNTLRAWIRTTDARWFYQSGTPVTIQDTTASTATNIGALVVSGGVGVAGNIWTGGQVNLAATSVEASTGINFGVANATSRDIVFFGDSSRGGMLRGYHDGSNAARLGFGYWTSSSDTYTSVIDITGSATTSSQLVAIAGTAGSTSTTSGALTVAGGMGVADAVNAGTFYGLVDGVTAPATGAGYARIYVDSADGDLKVKFSDGTVKTIATDS